MIKQGSAVHLLKKLVQESPADQTEAILLTEDSSLTRFAGSAVHQHVAERNQTVVLRVVLEKDCSGHNQSISAVLCKTISSEGNFSCQGSTTER